MTGGPGVTVELDIEVEVAEVKRYLGYRRGCEPRANIAARLAELWPRALALIAPRGSFDLVNRAAAAAFAMPVASDVVAVGLCTIGAAVERESQRFMDEGELLDGVLYDAFGSAAAEAAADALDQLVCASDAIAELHPARRISPGYGGWDVKWQAELLAALPAAELGISLTPGMMMVPRKSVSFAVPLREQCEALDDKAERCATCDLEHCRYRDRD